MLILMGQNDLNMQKVKRNVDFDGAIQSTFHILYFSCGNEVLFNLLCVPHCL